MKFQRSMLICLALLLLVPTWALAQGEYSAGPYTTTDSWGTSFTTQHYIWYDYYSDHIYDHDSELYINITGTNDEVNCGYGQADYSGNSARTFMTDLYPPFPYTFYNTPTWWIINWDRSMYYINGGYVQFFQRTGHLPDYSYCYSGFIPDLGGWTSAVDNNNNWTHQLLNGGP